MQIGADPEFVFSDGELVSAENLLFLGSSLGCDGDYETAEIRPYPSKTALGLVANTRELIKILSTNSNLKKLDVLAGHYKHDKPIGGHIHISDEKLDNFYELSECLDKVLGPLSNFIDNKKEKELRLQESYGRGYREKGKGYIEYRAPGSWLLSPKVAFLNLWLAQSVAELYIKNKSILRRLKIDTMDDIIKYAEQTTTEDKDLFIKTADKVFNKLPLNWNDDFKGSWV